MVVVLVYCGSVLEAQQILAGPVPQLNGNASAQRVVAEERFLGRTPWEEARATLEQAEFGSVAEQEFGVSGSPSRPFAGSAQWDPPLHCRGSQNNGSSPESSKGHQPDTETSVDATSTQSLRLLVVTAAQFQLEIDSLDLTTLCDTVEKHALSRFYNPSRWMENTPAEEQQRELSQERLARKKQKSQRSPQVGTDPQGQERLEKLLWRRNFRKQVLHRQLAPAPRKRSATPSPKNERRKRPTGAPVRKPFVIGAKPVKQVTLKGAWEVSPKGKAIAAREKSKSASSSEQRRSRSKSLSPRSDSATSEESSDLQSSDQGKEEEEADFGRQRVQRRSPRTRKVQPPPPPPQIIQVQNMDVDVKDL